MMNGEAGLDVMERSAALDTRVAAGRVGGGRRGGRRTHARSLDTAASEIRHCTLWCGSRMHYLLWKQHRGDR